MKRRIFSISIVLALLVLSSLVWTVTGAAAITATVTLTTTSTAIPGADFSGTPLSGSAPLTVQFTALNNNILSSCSWTYGDGTSDSFSGQLSVCPSTTHVYTTTGVYTVKLSVMKVTGATNSMTKTNYIQVGQLTPTPTLTHMPGCGTVVVVTSTPSPTLTPTPRVATATPTSCGPIFITATPNGTVTIGPDLVISSITPAISGPLCAVVRTNNVLVANTGNATAGTFMVSYNAGGFVAPAQTVNGLAAGQSITLSFPAATGSGMTITATTDSTGVISETNEANNSLTVGPFPVPTQAPTCTPTRGTPLTPTRTPTLPVITNTPTRTPTSVTGACSPVTSSITAPFTFDGAGTFCWQSSNLGTYINSWNTTSVTINGVNITNMYIASGSYPAKIGGFWYVGYNSSVAWGHFEAK